MNSKTEKFKQEVIRLASNPEFVHHDWFVKWHLEVVDKISMELLDYYPEADKELEEVGFDVAFTEKAVKYIEILDKKMEFDLRKAPIEVQIVSSADGCSHLVGPFFHFWWRENANKSIEELMADNNFKMDKDWNRKIVLPEARQAFEARYKIIREQVGALPEAYIFKENVNNKH